MLRRTGHLAAILIGLALLSASPALAGHPHWHGCGWRGGYGWGGGWGGGYGWGGGWGGWGPGYGFGFSVGYPVVRSYSFSCGSGYWPSRPFCATYDPCWNGCGYGYSGCGTGVYVVGSPYATYYRPAGAQVNYVLPPLNEPAELTWGPQAVKQFLGLDRLYPAAASSTPLTATVLKSPATLSAKPPSTGAIVKPRVSGPEYRRRASQLLAQGDELFRSQRYHEALQRYKSAADNAPDLAEPYFRQGHALVATNRFDLASRAFKRGLELESDVARDGFRLDDIYGAAKLSKTSHVEALAAAAIANPHDADALLLVGLFLQYDGEPDRAQLFFHRASALGAEPRHLAGFLPPDREAPRPVSRLDEVGL